MLSIANFVMKGQKQALFAILVLSALTVWIAPLGVLVGAIIALVTLRVGEQDGLKILLAATVVQIALSMLVSGSYWPGVVAVLEYMLPVWVLSWVLRATNSLALSLSLNILMVGAGVIAFHLFVGETAVWWMQVFNTYLTPVITQTGTTVPQDLMQSVADVATMLLAMFFVILWFVMLVWGRWWQSALYFPGKFRDDFYALRLPKNIALLAIVIALAGLFSESALIQDLSAVLMTGLMFQGLAVAHHAVNQRGMSSMWLGGLYLLLFLFPQTILILATIGLIDTWVDIRNKWTKA